MICWWPCSCASEHAASDARSRAGRARGISRWSRAHSLSRRKVCGWPSCFSLARSAPVSTHALCAEAPFRAAGASYRACSTAPACAKLPGPILPSKVHDATAGVGFCPFCACMAPGSAALACLPLQVAVWRRRAACPSEKTLRPKMPQNLAVKDPARLRSWLGNILLPFWAGTGFDAAHGTRSEEHTSELQSLMRISYAVFCLKKNNTKTKNKAYHTQQQYNTHNYT